MKYQQEKKSGFKYLFSPGNPDKPTVVMFHGYGANAADLYSIADLKFMKDLELNWIFLEAPMAPPQIAMFGGRAWFDVDISHFQKLIMEGRFKEYYSREPENIDKLHDKISLFLEAVRLTPNEVILGGFSQGAMVCTDFMYAKKYKARGLLFLSGTVIRHNLWMEGSLEGIPVFQSHGKHDEVLPVQGAMHFKSISKSKKHQLEIFQGGHEIPLEILKSLSEFLKTIS
jgi:phospholipase/carboxylesterase